MWSVSDRFGRWAFRRWRAGANEQDRRRKTLRSQLRRRRRRRYFAVVSGSQRRQIDGLRRQLLSDQTRTRLVAVGHRDLVCRLLLEKKTCTIGSEGRVLAPAEDVGGSPRTTGRHACRRQRHGGL